MTTDRARTACHEAGHAVTRYLLCGQAPNISIRPAAGHAGVCLRQPAQVDFFGHDRDAPLALAAPALRRQCETEVLVALAGVAAAEALVPRIGYQAEEPDLVAAGAREFSAAATAALAAAEALPPGDGAEGMTEDETSAFELAWRLVGSGAGDFLVFMRTEAKRFVLQHADLVVGLAGELQRRTLIPGPRVVAIIESIRREEEHPSAPPPTTT